MKKPNSMIAQIEAKYERKFRARMGAGCRHDSSALTTRKTTKSLFTPKPKSTRKSKPLLAKKTFYRGSKDIMADCKWPVGVVVKPTGKHRKEKVMDRKSILQTAIKTVCGDREQDYGSPENNFDTIARLWAAYLRALRVAQGGQNFYVKPKDVAAMLALLKIARIASGHAKDDNWIDLAGYAACGGELESKYQNRFEA